MMLAMSIGVAAVVVLTALGEGARRYVVDQFSSLGTNLVIVLPGRTETAGIRPGMLLGQIPREHHAGRCGSAAAQPCRRAASRR